MASASFVVEKLERHLECGICLERYKEPKVLSCLHSYCKRCLERLVTAVHRITCPECRKETEVPAGDVTALQTNFLINKLLTFGSDGQSKKSSCAKHDGESIKLFCRTCNQPICGSCTVVDHRNHIHKFLKDVVLKEKEEIEKSITKAKTNIPVFRSAMESIQKRERNVKENLALVCREVDSCIDEHVALLEGKRLRLKEELKVVASAQMSQLEDQKESVTLSLGIVESGVEFADQALARGSDVEVLSMKKQIIQQMKGFSSLPAPPKLPESIFYKLTANSLFDEEGVKKMAKISEHGEFVLSMLGGEPGVMYTTRAKQTCNFVITPRNNDAATERTGAVKVRIKKPDGVSFGSPVIKHNVTEGNISFSYRPDQTGSYGVEILLNGIPTYRGPLAWEVQLAFRLDQFIKSRHNDRVLPSKCSFQIGQHSWKTRVRLRGADHATKHRIGVTHSGGAAQSYWDIGRFDWDATYQNGDVFVCYLNLDKGQLIIYNERTKQSDSFLHCQPPVFPLVYPERNSHFLDPRE